MNACQSESTLYSCLNVKELLARSRREIWSWSDCNWTRTQNHLVLKRTLNHSDFAPASSKVFLDIQATIECGFTLKRVRDMTRTYSQGLLSFIWLSLSHYPAHQPVATNSMNLQSTYTPYLQHFSNWRRIWNTVDLRRTFFGVGYFLQKSSIVYDLQYSKCYSVQ